MIKLERTEVMNFENAIRGMRNPLNSWHKSDSKWVYNDPHSYDDNSMRYELGENDLNLAKRLCNAGSDHGKFLRQIFVSVDITAPLYWFKEYDTYKVGTVANSTSTMHKIHAKEFTIDDFSHEQMNDLAVDSLLDVVDTLNWLRDEFLETKDKRHWYSMIQLLPSSYNQMRTCTLNYENLRSMYHSRRLHRLEEWRDFCKWIEALPYSKELIS